jgi:excisionase family DNA binding protein
MLQQTMRAYTVQQVAEMVATTPYVIRRQIYSGRLKACKFNSNQVRVMESDFLEWLERSVQPPKTQDSDPDTNGEIDLDFE